jgi:23S rRNA pseudouridine2605 synthase
LNSKDSEEKLRLQVYLARAGVASRRKCEQYIQEGRVEVNGAVVDRLGAKCSPYDRVVFDGKEVQLQQEHIYVALNKPPGYLCSNDDPFGRPLAIDLLRNHFETRLFHVGRLDLHSSGLIFFTNDGKFATIVAHPSSEIEKEYQVTTKQPIRESILQTFLNGVTIEGVHYTLISYKLEGHNCVYLTLNEGKKREIRRLFAYMNLDIIRLHRVRIGPVTIEGIASGEYRHLTRDEIESLTRSASK